jgi:hypothetical protein
MGKEGRAEREAYVTELVCESDCWILAVVDEKRCSIEVCLGLAVVSDLRGSRTRLTVSFGAYLIFHLREQGARTSMRSLTIWTR